MVSYQTYVEEGNSFKDGDKRTFNLSQDINGNSHSATIICDGGSMDICLLFNTTEGFGATIPIKDGETFNFAKVREIELKAKQNNSMYRIIAGTASGFL